MLLPLQVWDRRALRGNRPAGVLVGHTEGLTHLDSRGDGRYLLSNCKDQTARLWDIRKVAMLHVPVMRIIAHLGMLQCLQSIVSVAAGS